MNEVIPVIPQTIHNSAQASGSPIEAAPAGQHPPFQPGPLERDWAHRTLCKGRWLVGLLLLTCIPSAFSRPFRPALLPNGSRFNCANCHVNPNGGGARNSFGLDVEAIVGDASRTPFWSAALAALDSDGDGFTNGQELGDTDGDGTATPGAPVTNPGSASSKPNRLLSAAFLRPTGANPVARGSKISIEASALDSDGTIVRVELLLGADIVATVNSAPFVFNLETSSLIPGTLDLGLRSIDNRGGVSPVVRLALTLLPELRIQMSAATAGHPFEIAWPAPVETRFVVEASFDLLTWTQVGVVTATAEGAKFTESQPRKEAMRFYRIGLPE